MTITAVVDQQMPTHNGQLETEIGAHGAAE